jgi:3-oxoacyl-[acyl-carrier protein] reductase
MNLDNKKVIITGAARGIGYAIAQEFLRAGAQVALCSTTEEGATKAKENLLKEFPQAKVYAQKADVSKETEVQTFVDNVLKEFGTIDILVNNAGITRDTLAIRMSEQDWDAVLNVNLKGTFLMSKAVLKIMMKAKSGSIVNMSSVVGQSGNAAQVNYSASKAGIIGLTKSLAKEFASRNIRVNAVAPGFVQTDMTDKLSDQIKEQTLALIPLKRFATTTDIAKAVMFLSSDDGGYITGQILAVNGGLYI